MNFVAELELGGEREFEYQHTAAVSYGVVDSKFSLGIERDFIFAGPPRGANLGRLTPDTVHPKIQRARTETSGIQGEALSVKQPERLTRRHILKCSMGALAMCAGSTVGMTGAGRAEEAGNLAEGSERRVYTDPVTGRAIWQLTNSNLESKHSYYDACPWNYDGSLIVVNSIDPAHLSVGPKGAYGSSLVGKDAMVRVISTKDWTIRTIAKEASYNSHTGSFALWHPKKNRVFFHRADGEVGVVDVDSGEEAIFPGGLRQLAPDGSMMVYFANSEKASSEQYDSRQLPITGVYVASTDGSESHEVVSEEELYNLAPNRDEFTLDDMTIGNSKWHPSSEYILVANFIHPVPSAKRSLFVVKKDGSEARWLCHFVHHHSWTPNGESVLFNGQTSEGKIRMFMVDFDGSNLRLVIDEPIGSHPVMSVDGNTIADFDWKGIYITRVREQKVERLAEFKETFPMDVSGTHPHPVWSRDGKQLLYNSAETGHSEVYIIPDLA